METNNDVRVWANCYYNSLEDDGIEQDALTIERDTTAFQLLQDELLKDYAYQDQEKFSIDYI
jgi:hypothetical protein